MTWQPQAPDAFVVTVVEPAAREITIADVILGSFGLVAVLLLVAAALGGLLSLVLIGWARRHPPEADHLPPVSPFIRDPGARPSSPVR